MGDYSLSELLLIVNTALLFIIIIGVYKKYVKKVVKLGKVFLRRFFGVLIYNTARLFPRTKRIVVFGAENGRGFRGNPKYIFMNFPKEGLRCIWILKDQRVVRQLRKKGYEAYYYHSLKGIYFQLRAKLFIHSHSIHDDFNRYLLGGATSVNTWHGVGLKKVWGANESTFTYKALHEKSKLKRFIKMMIVRTNLAKESYIISTSDRVSSYYPETFLIPKEKILKLGQARNDVFFQDSEEDEKFPKYIKENKIITYMPTHRNFGKLDKNINEVFNLRKLDAFCEEYGYLFLVKRHMYSEGRLPQGLKHVKDISHDNIDPQLLLKYTDILITDYSSCYTDYLLLDRPVIFYCYDLDEYLMESNEMYFDYHEVTPGPKVEDFAALLQSLEELAENKDSFQEERGRVLDIFYAKENQQVVTPKQVDYIYNQILHKKSG